jgi:hypothetical protein
VDPNERRAQTEQNVRDLINHREPKKVPSSLNIEAGWGLMYAGVKWTDVEDDPETFARAYTKAHREIPIDIGGGPTRTSLRPAHALGNYMFVYTSDGGGIVHNQAADRYLGPEVYDEIITDRAGLMDRFGRMNNPAFLKPRAEAVEAVRNAAKAQLIANQTSALISKICREEIGMFSMYGFDFGSPGFYYGYTGEFWTFYDRLRGPQMALSDLRRYPDKVQAACDFLYEQTKARVVYDEESMKQEMPFGSSMFHPESYFSPAQFDNFYFKNFMEIMLPVMEAGKKVFLYGEGAFMKHIDRFRETPKSSMIIVLDQDDPFEAKKRVGDWCTLVAGPKAELLQLGTTQQIKDFVKRCFDELAPGGGYIFALGNGLIAAKDAPVSGIVTAYETAYELSTGGKA